MTAENLSGITKDARTGKLQATAPTSASISTDSRDAALRGAAMAFSSKSSKPPVKPKPNIPSTALRNDGALAAARLSSARVHDAEGRLLPYQRTGESSSSSTFDSSYEPRPVLPQRLSYMSNASTNQNDQLQVPTRPGPGAKSTSFIAANLAASRSASVTPNHTGQSTDSLALQMQLSQRRTPQRTASPSPSPMRGQRPSASSGESGGGGSDNVPRPQMNSLIGMFENAGKATGKAITSTATPAKPKPKPKPSQMPAKLESETRREEPKMKPAPPAPISRVSNADTKPRPTSLPPASKPRDIPLRKQSIRAVAKTAEREQRDSPGSSSSSLDSFVSASEDNATVARPPVPPPPRRRQTARSIGSTTGGTMSEVESLADAIVASSIAQSRASSPSKSLGSTAPLPPPRRGQHRHSRFTAPFHHESRSRNASPSRGPGAGSGGGMRQTMRKPPKQDDEETKTKAKKHLTKKHAHHEGDRKRWRNAVIERERRRYEAVWASNRGLYMVDSAGKPCAFPDERAERVLNLVVRDIWSRSRLSADVLEEVYELVDRSHSGSLDKEEFVVGLWLIDQRLKGRKLPIKVSPSVWQSVGRLGVKVRHHR